MSIDKITRLLLSSAMFMAVVDAATAKTQLIHPKYRKHPSHAEKIQVDKLNIYGYVEGSYNYLTNRNRFITGEYNRVFDRKPNGFSLNQASLTVEYSPPGIGFVLNPVLGSDAAIMAPYGIRPYSQAKSRTFAVDLSQAFLQYKMQNLALYAGRFYSVGGRESVNTTINSNFSRSILFLTNPDFVLGVRGIYRFEKKAKLILGLNNGWDNLRDYNRRPTFEIGGAYIFNQQFEIEGAIYTGEERTAFLTDKGPKATRNLVDLLATYHHTESLSFSLNYNYMLQSRAQLPTLTPAIPNYGRAEWDGWAAYVNYKFARNLRVALRGEIFHDKDGFPTGIKQNWKEVTLTLGYHPFKNVELRAEARRDFSNKNSFVNSNNKPMNYQQSYALQGFVTFADAFSIFSSALASSIKNTHQADFSKNKQNEE